MVNLARFVSSIFRTLRVTQAPVRAVFGRLAIVCAFAGWVLPLGVLAQNTQIPCPIRTPVNIAPGASLFNNARCNVEAGVTIQAGGSLVNMTAGAFLIGDDQMPPLFNALVLNAGMLANDGVMIIEPTSGSLINTGTLNNEQLELFNYHTLLNNGTFNNLDPGDFINGDAGTFNNLKTMNSSGRIENTGIINNLNGGIINLLPPISFGGDLINSSGGP
jgi:hypothetical protein